jgi:hypothetical protein
MRRAALALILLLLTMAAPAAAEEWGFSPGVKLAWTPGRGITYGIEVSVIRLPDIIDPKTGDLVADAIDGGIQFITKTYGVVVNFETTFKGMTQFRVGGEWVGPFIGLEVGPAIVYQRGHGTHLGLGFTPWVGYGIIGFYTFTWAFGDAPNMHELGLYLKAPLLGFGPHEGHHLHHIDD